MPVIKSSKTVVPTPACGKLYSLVGFSSFPLQLKRLLTLVFNSSGGQVTAKDERKKDITVSMIQAGFACIDDSGI